MDKVQSDFLKLLKKSISSDNSVIKDIDYNELKSLALNHMCLGLVCDGLWKSNMDVPPAWKNSVVYNVQNIYKNLNVQNKVLDILSKNNIPCVILKGITVAIYYPNPSYRPLGDIDILVKEEDYENAINAFSENKERNEQSEKHAFHYKFYVDGISVEIHKYVTEFEDNIVDEKIVELFKDATSTTVEKNFNKYKFPSLNNELQVISLILHASRHFTEHKTNFKMICDYALFVKSISEEEWNGKIYPKLKELNLHIFSDALINISHHYLGIDLLQKAEYKFKENELKNLVTEFLCDGAVPTYNDNDSSLFKKIKYLFLSVDNIVRRDFSFVMKFPVAYPFLYLFVPMRSLYRKLMGRRKGITITGFSNATSRRNEWINKLNIK